MHMPSPARAILLLVLFAIPLLEIVLLVKVGQAIGFWWTVLIVLGTAVGGTFLLRRQGIGTLRRVMAAAATGQPPVAPVLDGVVTVIAALLLITPGLFADALGLLLLLPPVRALAVHLVMSRLVVTGASWQTAETFREARHEPGEPDTTQTDMSRDKDGIIIEGEYTRIEERTVDPRRPREPGRNGGNPRR